MLLFWSSFPDFKFWGAWLVPVVSQVLRRLQDLVSSERSPLTDKMFVAHNPMQPQTTSWAQPTPPDMYFSKNASSKDARFWGGWRLFDTISTCSNMFCTNISAKYQFVKIFGDGSFNMSFNTFNIVFPPPLFLIPFLLHTYFPLWLHPLTILVKQWIFLH